eukprot:COSAG04_NODE_32851_length_193_cov_61.212766_1_plen_37_part_01
MVRSVCKGAGINHARDSSCYMLLISLASNVQHQSHRC